MRHRPLQPGDIVDVVAPASACTKLELKKGLAAIRLLGLIPRVPKDLFAPSLLFSNSDAQRLVQLKRAVCAPDSKLIWCVRGGYGAIRLMPEIERWKKPKTSKILLGYSDITTLHVHFNQKWKWPTLHGPLLDRLGRGALTPSEHKELFGLLFGRQESVEFGKLVAMNAPARKSRTIRALIVGGNMAVLQSALGTPSSLRPKNNILFFEDTGERPHRVDRMLTQFSQAGWFKDCRAIVLGHFLLNSAKDRRGLWSDVFARFAREAKIPLVSGLPIGHDPRQQRTLPLWTPAELHLGSKPSLTVHSGILCP